MPLILIQLSFKILPYKNYKTSVMNRSLKEFLEKNYEQSAEECMSLIFEASINYALTEIKLIEGLKRLRSISFEKQSIEVDLTVLGNLSLVGVSVSGAAEPLRTALLLTSKQKKHEVNLSNRTI